MTNLYKTPKTKKEAESLLADFGMLPEWTVEPEKCADVGESRRARKRWGGRKFINLEEFRRICRCTSANEGIAAYFNVSTSTIENVLKKPKYREAFESGRADAKNIIGIKQMEKAMRGDTTMLIWLGKNLLGQKDVIKNEQTRSMDDDVTEAMAASEEIKARLASKDKRGLRVVE
jgi:hypothetical protein